MKTKPKKRNLSARKRRSRHEKVECGICGKKYHKSSLKAHYAMDHSTTEVLAESEKHAASRKQTHEI